MDKTKLSRLKEVIFLRSSLIPLDGIEELFALNDKYSPDQILALPLVAWINDEHGQGA